MFSFSTSWNAGRHSSGRELVAEIRELGFSAIEVNYRVRARALADIKALVRAGEVSVPSLHNAVPCSEDQDLATAHSAFPLSSPEKKVRQRGIDLARWTLDHACELGAQAVVLHLGEVEMPGAENLEREYRLFLKDGKTDQAAHFKQKMIAERSRHAAGFFGRALESLHRIALQALTCGVRLGIENRYHWFQVPSFDELQEIFRQFPGETVGYWHDVGHAQTMENTGFTAHLAYLDAFGPRLVGCHLMDCVFDRDHLACGAGEIDFSVIAPYLRDSVLKVFELGQAATPEDIAASVPYLAKFGIQ